MFVGTSFFVFFVVFFVVGTIEIEIMIVVTVMVMVVATAARKSAMDGHPGGVGEAFPVPCIVWTAVVIVRAEVLA